MNEKTLKHLARVDAALGEIIEQVGPCRLEPDVRRSRFQGLVHAVAHQQLNGKAANTILTRFLALFPHGRFPSPEDVSDLDPSRLTGAGFSRAKASYIQGIARGALEGIVPSRKAVERWSDDQIIERLTALKGVGQWTVEMFLIFGLGRPDVLPAHDFGIRTGFAKVYRKRTLPDPSRIVKHGERWRPYRTTASWYLWRAVELGSQKPG